MDQQEIILEARFTAIEIFLASLYAEKYAALPNGAALVRARAQRLRDAMAPVVLPGLDAVVSDAVTAEFQDALSNLADQIVEMVEREIHSQPNGASE